MTRTMKRRAASAITPRGDVGDDEQGRRPLLRRGCYSADHARTRKGEVARGELGFGDRFEVPSASGSWPAA